MSDAETLARTVYTRTRLPRALPFDLLPPHRRLRLVRLAQDHLDALAYHPDLLARRLAAANRSIVP